MHFAGLIHQCRREVQVVHEEAEAKMALSNAQGFAYWWEGGMARMALVHQCLVEKGLTQLRQGLDSWLP